MGGYELTVYWGQGPYRPINENVDVEIQLSDGRRYGATFFTLANIEALMRMHEETGENLGGLYLWSCGMVVIRELEEGLIRRCIDDLLRKGDLGQAFEELAEVDLGGQ